MNVEPNTPTTVRRAWSVEAFARFWANHDPSVVPMALTDDVVGFWSGRPEQVRGKDAYTACIAALVNGLPGVYVTPVERAADGELTFILGDARHRHAWPVRVQRHRPGQDSRGSGRRTPDRLRYSRLRGTGRHGTPLDLPRITVTASALAPPCSRPATTRLRDADPRGSGDRERRLSSTGPNRHGDRRGGPAHATILSIGSLRHDRRG